ncbi:acyltransferase family protein [Massilia sp. TSP1-1-2]|uniref:acyltransferase family protein n=1 Tax=Massilia sp. TSP1-1-2 TaxID=2804649 RepID=UPI003CEA0478
MMLAAAKASTKVLVAAVIVTFLGGVFIQYIGSYQLLGSTNISKIFSLSWPHRNFLFFSFPFFCAGYLINKHKIHNRFTTRTALTMAGFGAVLMFAESYLNFIGTAAAAGVDNLVSLALICPAIFILFMKLNLPTDSRELARYSTGIYLVHVLIISLLQKTFEIPPTALTAWTAIAATALAAVLIRLDRKLGFLL